MKYMMTGFSVLIKTTVCREVKLHHWSESHQCISLQRRSWGIQMPRRQSHPSLSPHSQVACPHWAWYSPQCSGSCDLQICMLVLCSSGSCIWNMDVTAKHIPLYSTMMQVSISGCTPSIRIMNLRCSSIWQHRKQDNGWLHYHNSYSISLVALRKDVSNSNLHLARHQTAWRWCWWAQPGFAPDT